MLLFIVAAHFKTILASIGILDAVIFLAALLTVFKCVKGSKKKNE